MGGRAMCTAPLDDGTTEGGESQSANAAIEMPQTDPKRSQKERSIAVCGVCGIAFATKEFCAAHEARVHKCERRTEDLASVNDACMVWKSLVGSKCVLGEIELSVMLSDWGMPGEDVDRLLLAAISGGDGKSVGIDKDAFCRAFVDCHDAARPTAFR